MQPIPAHLFTKYRTVSPEPLEKTKFKRTCKKAIVHRSPCVYVLQLQTQKHIYIGSTDYLVERLRRHAAIGGARATSTYGFTNNPINILFLVSCSSRQQAYDLEWSLACKYRQLFPDTPICSDGYSFGTPNADQFE